MRRFEDLRYSRRGIARAILVLSAVLPCLAASVPSWLDDAITKWNSAHAESQIQFVDIKDSFVWYDVAKTPEIGSQQIRERVNNIVLAHGYTPMDDEELVTTGKPPVKSGRVVAKKCWSRSFILDIKAQENAKTVGEMSATVRQRVLTSLVCDDSETWWAAFRVAG